MRWELLIVAAGAYLLMSLITFIIFWRDKRAAQRGNWRTSEKTLLGLSLLGGWPGAIIAMKLVRHKTRHLRFKLGIPLIGALHLAAWITLGAVILNDSISN
ncbi:MAG: DUF1294 domain-containing protein [Planctomycetota bacterium]